MHTHFYFQSRKPWDTITLADNEEDIFFDDLLVSAEPNNSSENANKSYQINENSYIFDK